MMVGSGSRKWLLAGLIVAIAVTGIAVVACGGDGDEASDPEQTVQAMMSGMEAKDIDAIIAIMDSEGLAQVAEEMDMTVDQFKQMMESTMSWDSMKFEGVKFETEISEDGQTAKVAVVEGIVTTVEGGVETVEDIKEGEPEVFYLVLRDGKWYLDMGSGM